MDQGYIVDEGAGVEAKPGRGTTAFGLDHQRATAVAYVRNGAKRESAIALLGWRLLERMIALVALIAAAPAMAIIAVVVRRGTPGPAIFRQHRIGLGGKPFTFFKFRTHFTDSKERFPQHCSYEFQENELRAVRLQEKDDPRVTPHGTWLRRTSLDELPNFWHVVTGDMALVGPRPEMVEMLPYYHGEMLDKFTVRPGITGFAQISGRGELTFYETVRYDLDYVRTKSIKNDFRMLVRTIKLVLVQDGAF